MPVGIINVGRVVSVGAAVVGAALSMGVISAEVGLIPEADGNEVACVALIPGVFVEATTVGADGREVSGVGTTPGVVGDAIVVPFPVSEGAGAVVGPVTPGRLGVGVSTSEVVPTGGGIVAGRVVLTGGTTGAIVVGAEGGGVVVGKTVGGVEGIKVALMMPETVALSVGRKVGVCVGIVGKTPDKILDSTLPNGTEAVVVGTEGGGVSVVTGTTEGAEPPVGAGVDGGSVAVVVGSRVDKMDGIPVLMIDGRSLVTIEPISLVSDPRIGRIPSVVLVVAAAVVAGAGSVEPPVPVNVTPKGESVSIVEAAAWLVMVGVGVTTPPGPNVMAPESEVEAAAGGSIVVGAAGASGVEVVCAVGRMTIGGISPDEAAGGGSVVVAAEPTSEVSSVVLGLAVGRITIGGITPVEAAAAGSVLEAAAPSPMDSEISKPPVEAAATGSVLEVAEVPSVGLAVGRITIGGMAPLEAAAPGSVLEAAAPSPIDSEISNPPLEVTEGSGDAEELALAVGKMIIGGIPPDEAAEPVSVGLAPIKASLSEVV